MNQLLAIRAFIRVVETSSFTKTAETLGIPKTSVSKLIKDLEDFLGASLLHRTTRSVSATSDGARYYGRIVRVIQDIEGINLDFQNSQSSPRGDINVGVDGSIANSLLIPALPDFIERFPNINIHLHIKDFHNERSIENLDCVIRCDSKINISLDAKIIGKASWVTCASPSYLKRFRVPTYPGELENNHHIITLNCKCDDPGTIMTFERADEKFEAICRGPLFVNDRAAQISAGLAGLGIIRAFNHEVKSYIESGRLITLLEDWQPAPYIIHASISSNRHTRNLARAFLDWLKEKGLTT